MTSRTVLMLSCALALLASLPEPARAQRASSEARALLEAGRAHYAELEYGEAVAALTAALGATERDEGLRAEILETLAFAYFVAEREQAARDALRQLFGLDPYYVVREPSGSPRVSRFVESVRATVVRDAAIDPAIALRSELPRAARSDRPVEIAVTATADVASVELVYRTDTSAAWRRVDGRRLGDAPRFVLELPALDEAREVALYVEARDAQRRVLARDAGPLTPISLDVTRPDRGEPERRGSDLLAEPWLWIVVGALVVGAGVGIGVGIAATSEPVPTGTLPPGRVVLP
jgi:tetratricopeptide (TPR) repeat protein